MCSINQRGDCWDNAVVESVLATLKRELVAEVAWTTHAEAEADPATDLDSWYNIHRRHSTLGHLNPAAFETRLASAA